MKPDMENLRRNLEQSLAEFGDVFPDFCNMDADGMTDDEAVEMCLIFAKQAEDRDSCPIHPDNIEDDARTVIDNLLSAARALETAIEDQEIDHDQPSQ